MDPVLCGSSAMADPVQSPSWIGCDANKDTVTALLCSALCSKSTVAKNRPSQRRGPDAQRRRDGGPGLAPQPRQESTVLLHLRGGKFDSIDIQQRGGGDGGISSSLSLLAVNPS